MEHYLENVNILIYTCLIFHIFITKRSKTLQKRILSLVVIFALLLSFLPVTYTVKAEPKIDIREDPTTPEKEDPTEPTD